jgi:hypothetical protein
LGTDTGESSNNSNKKNKKDKELKIVEFSEIKIDQKLIDFFIHENLKAWKILILEKNIMEEEICLDLIQRKIKARGDELKVVHFKNVNPLKIGNLNYVINLIRDLKEIHTLIIENCVLN